MYTPLSKIVLSILTVLTFCITLVAQDELDADGSWHDFDFTGEVEDFVIPHNIGTYNAIEFSLKGGDGGDADIGSCFSAAGDGAEVEAVFLVGNGTGELPPGSTIRFIVGDAGTPSTSNSELGTAAGGGGGGTAVLVKYPNSLQWVILAVAGGGGGAYQGNFITGCVDNNPGQGGQTSSDGGDGDGNCCSGSGGSNGNGGDGGGDIGDGDLAGGGGGAFSNGKGGSCYEGKAGFPSGGDGGCSPNDGEDGGWGFGGGGGADESAGGGGGYSGGGGGGTLGSGGGGGSYVADFHYTSTITGGGRTSGSARGDLDYAFRRRCVLEITNVIETVSYACNSETGATVETQYTSTNCSDLTFFLNDLQDNNPFPIASNNTGIFTGLPISNYQIFILADGVFLDAYNFSIGDVDLIPPVAICQDITLELEGSSYINVNFGNEIDAGSTDDCAIVSLMADQNAFDCSSLGTHQVQLTVTDETGNTSTCMANVTVEDVAAPDLVCGASTINLDENGEVVLQLADAPIFSVSDNCTPTADLNIFWQDHSVTYTCSDIGTRQLWVAANDASGNQFICNASLTIQDNTAPTFECKDITIQLDVNNQATITKGDILHNFQDNCLTDAEILNLLFIPEEEQTSFTCQDVGTHQVLVGMTTSSVWQHPYNTTCTANVTVRDANPPTVTCSDVTVQLDANGSASITPAQVTASISDDCSVPSTSVNPSQFGCADTGVQTVTLTATDGGGNTNTCTASITVGFPPPPVALCAPITVALDQNGAAVIAEDAVGNGSTSTCGINYATSPNTFDCSTLGGNTVTLTFTDDLGQASTCSTTVQVEDQTPPQAQCQSITVTLPAFGSITIAEDAVDNNSSDACALSYDTDQTYFTCADVGATTVTMTVTDAGGNQSTCQANVQINDVTAPIANCQDLTVALDDTGNTSVVPEDFTGSSHDVCNTFFSFTNYETNTLFFDCTDIGTTFDLNITISDGNGNFSQCTASLSLIDETPPVVSCQPATLQLDANGNANLSLAQVFTGAMDACGTANTTMSQNAFDCSEVGTNTVVVTTTDNNGNTGTCTATVSVEDNILPQATCLEVTVQLGYNGQAVSNDIVIEASDECGIAETIFVNASNTFDCDDIGANPVEIIVIDNNNNETSCTAVYHVVDEFPPTASCQNLFIMLDENGTATISPEEVGQGTTDACGLSDLSLNFSTFTTEDLGNNPVVLTVTDNYGNTSFCTAIINVSGLPPGWSIDPAGIGCDPGNGNYDPDTQTFELTSNECYDPSYYRQNDQHGFIQKDLCRDGEIIAEITEVIGNGWVGISMRESNNPSARMIQLMINGMNLTRREARMSAGSPAYAHVFQTQGKNWLRLTRTGNQFTAHHSSDGNNWSTVFSTQIAMSNCIYVGLITMNGSTSGEVTGVYNNVSVSGTNSLATPVTVDIAQESTPTLDFNLYPNPATDEVNLQLDQFMGKEVILRLYNHHGQTLLQKPLGEVQYSTERLNLGQFGPGTYLVELQSGSDRVTKKVVVVSM